MASADNTALTVPRGNPLVALSEELEQRRNDARALEVQVARKEAELQRAKEEQALLKELRTMNEMTLRKREQQEVEQSKRGLSGRLKISPESLAELTSIENRIKLENKRTKELQSTAALIAQQLDDVEKAIQSKSARLIIVKRSTGWDKNTNTARCGTDAVNEYREHQRILTNLQQEQIKVKATTDRLTKTIEELTQKLEVRAQLEEAFKESYAALREKDAEYTRLEEEKKSLERLAKKKERLLDEMKHEDSYKAIRQMEGDKRVLHHNLARTRDATLNNSKAIMTQEGRLRQLETRLEAVNMFLAQVFAGLEDEEMEGVPPGETGVEVRQFDDLLRELNLSRQTVLQRNDQLEMHDGAMEQLEKKVAIMHKAITSRAKTATLQVREKDKEFDNLLTHEDNMRSEFEDEYENLKRENELLRQKLGVF